MTIAWLIRALSRVWRDAVICDLEKVDPIRDPSARF